jgi:TolB-like protein
VRHKLSISVGALCGLLIAMAPTSVAQKILFDAVSDLATQIAKHVTKEQKTRVAVIPFRELGGEPTLFGTYVAEELVTDLVITSGLDLVERTTLDKVMGELKLNESGAIDPAAAKQVGKLVGADAIVTGTITDLQSYVGVNCRMIDTQTGRIFAAAEAKIAKDDDVKKIMGVPMAHVAATHSKETPLAGGQQSSKQPMFEVDSYRITAESLRKVGNTATLLLTLESHADKTLNFSMEAGCYLLDENGERWNQERGADSAGFTGFYGVELIPNTRIKSSFKLAAQGADTGLTFTFVCTEHSPQYPRKIVLRQISAR